MPAPCREIFVEQSRAFHFVRRLGEQIALCKISGILDVWQISLQSLNCNRTNQPFFRHQCTTILLWPAIICFQMTVIGSRVGTLILTPTSRCITRYLLRIHGSDQGIQSIPVDKLNICSTTYLLLILMQTRHENFGLKLCLRLPDTIR